MACLGVQIGSSACRQVSVSGRQDTHCQFRHSLTEFRDERRSNGVCFAKLGKSRNYGGATVECTLRLALAEVKRSASDKKRPATTPQFDQLMKRSIAEIVKNIHEAPFLVHVYYEDDNEDANQPSSNSPLKLEIDKSTSESWPFIRQRWERGISAAPDGVILVEELISEEDLLDTDKEEIASSSGPVCTSNQQFPPSSTKVWGLLVQGRGGSFPACYILKTCRVQCCSGFSTHFCLAKVDCFGKSIDFYLKRSWLQ